MKKETLILHIYLIFGLFVGVLIEAVNSLNKMVFGVGFVFYGIFAFLGYFLYYQVKKSSDSLSNGNGIALKDFKKQPKRGKNIGL